MSPCLQPQAVAGQILPPTGHLWSSAPGPGAGEEPEDRVTLGSPGIRDVCLLHAALINSQHI